MDLSDEEMDDDQYADWEQEEGEATLSVCLFCDKVFPSPGEVFSHCQTEHNFNITDVCRTWQLDCFGYIKMINFIRAKKVDPKACIKKSDNSSSKPPWDSDEFMRPYDPEDELLQFDIEELLQQSVFDQHSACNGAGYAYKGGADLDPDKISVSRSDYELLLERLRLTEEKCIQQEEQLQRAVSDLEKIRLSTKDLVISQSTGVTSESGSTCEEDLEDDPYFNSYAHYSIHEEMLKDRVRTESYRDFMYKNRDVFRDKLVLDVGCGTGILSMFAATAGAKQVYAVDQSEIIYQAMDIVRENEMTDKITFIKGRLEDITLPVEKVDIIISEWMGYFLLFESMLDSVLFARAKYLKHDGVVYPDRCSISMTTMSDLDLYNKHVTFWEDVYGFSMSCMKSSVVREASVEIVNKDKVTSNAVVLKELDICECGLSDLQFSKDFTLTVTNGQPITALVAYFDIYFDRNCTEKVSFSTGPDHSPTHWKQSVFLLDKPMPVKKGDVLKGNLVCRKNRKDPRSLNITVHLNDKHLSYLME